MWWTLVGSAVEHASRLHQRHVTERVAAMVDDPPACPPVAVNFRDLFLVQEEDDEENAALSDALKALQAKWQTASFQAFDLARFLNEQSDYMLDAERERIATLRDFLYPDTAAHQVITSKGVGKRLKKHNGEPVKVGKQTFCLKMGIDTHTKVATFHVLVT